MYTKIENIPQIVHSLRETFKKGMTKNDINYRRQQLLKFKQFLTEQKDVLSVAVKQDLHKHPFETFAGEIAPVLGEIEYMLTNLDQFSKTEVVKPHYTMNSTSTCAIRKEPKGVVLVIGSWNFPIHLLLLPVVGAIAAGNCVVMKPSEISAHTAEIISNLLPKYLDPLAYTVVQGGSEETVALLEQKFDHIFYTGSSRIGKQVMVAAARHLTPVTLELGGKSPVIVAPDADLKVAANRIMWGKLFNGGQVCVAPDYVLIAKNQVHQFAQYCRESVNEMFGKDPQQSECYCRAVNERRFDILQAFIDSVDDKSQILFGGNTDRNDLYVAPTLIGPVEPAGHPLMDEEIFGPILPIVPIETIDDAIDIINSKDTPLVLYIFSNNQQTRDKILNSTQSGGVVINDLLIHVQESSLPFGGVGESGMGSYHGKKSFDTFTHERSTMIQTSGMETAMYVRYPPYTKSKEVLFNLLACGLPEGLLNKAKSIYEVIGSTKDFLLSK